MSHRLHVKENGDRISISSASGTLTRREDEEVCTDVYLYCSLHLRLPVLVRLSPLSALSVRASVIFGCSAHLGGSSHMHVPWKTAPWGLVVPALYLHSPPIVLFFFQTPNTVCLPQLILTHYFPSFFPCYNVAVMSRLYQLVRAHFVCEAVCRGLVFHGSCIRRERIFFILATVQFSQWQSFFSGWYWTPACSLVVLCLVSVLIHSVALILRFPGEVGCCKWLFLS